MNDFTKEELHLINNALHVYLENSCPIEVEHVQEKVKFMIDNYSTFNKNQIAKSHLQEAESLIGHAMCLLGMRNE